MRIGQFHILAAAWMLAAGPAQAQFEVLDPPALAPEAPASQAATPQGEVEGCGETITIADLGWPSASILAHIHATLLRTQFECEVRLVPGEAEATLSSMATTQQPAVAPELWVSRQAEVWNGAMQAGSARAAAPTFSDGPLEAWFIPAYLREAHPQIQGTGDIPANWEAFVGEGDERARLISCPADWACSIITRNMAAGLGLDERFDIVEPSDRFEMDQALTDAVARREPVLAYYWQPNALIDRLDLVPLDMGGFDPGNAQCMAIRDCVPFGRSGFAPDTVVVAVAERIFVNAPDVADYLARASMPLPEMNRLLAWQAEQEATPDAVAQHFLITGRDLWQSWVGTDEQELEEDEGGDVE